MNLKACDEAPQLLAADALKEALLRRMEQGNAGEQPLDTLNLLNEHPELWEDASFVVGLAFEEYLQHLDRGQELDKEAFADRFPPCRTMLLRVLALNHLVQHNPSLFNQHQAPWPKLNETWLGFTLLEELGRGAFSRVYLANQVDVGNRRVALKVSLIGAHEAQLLGQLDHPHIVPILGVHVDEATGWTAIAMPYRGRYTLKHVIDRTIHITGQGCHFPKANDRALREKVPPLNPDLFIRIGVQIGSALAAAHAAGITHGDLKPSNVLIDDRGNALILDFNLAGQLSRQHRLPWGGTFAYMAPEQLDAIASGAAVPSCTPHSDLFALGVLLHELLTGRHPYSATFSSISELPPRELAVEIRKLQDALLTVRYPGLEPGTAKILRSCVAVSPEDRPSSAASLSHALTSRQRPNVRLHRLILRHPWTSIATATLSAGVLIASLIWLSNRPPEAERRLQYALSELSSGNLSDSIENLQISVASDPGSVRARLALAYAYQMRGDIPLALAQYEGIRQLNDDPRAAAGVAYCQGLLGHQAVAIAAGKEALDRGLRTPPILNNLAFSLSRHRQHPEAEALLTEAIQARHDLSVLFLNRALCRWMQSSQPPQSTLVDAFADIRKAIELDPENVSLRVVAAQIAASGDHEDEIAKSLLRDSLVTAIALGWDVRNAEQDQFLKRISIAHVVGEYTPPTGPLRATPELVRLHPPFAPTDL